MSVESIFPQLEQVLPTVGRPVQYVGGEVGTVVKDWDSTSVRWVLMYPDTYEVGLPNQGLQILYELLNESPETLAERTYAVAPDMEQAMRERGIPQFTYDAHRPVSAFDLFGISLSTELGFTNVLTALDLAGIPLESSDRDQTHPVVVVGGHSATNPEPLAEFIDAVVLGDGEEAVQEITDIVRAWKAEGRPEGRDGLLMRMARTGRIYVPRFYDVEYADDGRIRRVAPNRAGVPPRVVKYTVADLDSWRYPQSPIVPLAETVHERYAIEIFRGCTRGCRFCQAGMIMRPVRERSITAIGEMVERGLSASGFCEVGLLSLSSADHSEIREICSGLGNRYAGANVSLSLPSTRVDAFNITLAEELSRNGRRTGLTFAPEGGSERIRRVINKRVSEDDLIRTVVAAYSSGWRQVKLYFMCGLPTETDEDVVQIAQLAQAVVRAGRKATGTKDIRVTVSIGGFVPKPHTPFQWAAACDAEEINRRIRLLKQTINADRGLGRAIGIRYADGEPTLIEGLLARGDRRLGAVIRRVWEDGGRFDGWSEHFSYLRWSKAAEDELSAWGVDLAWFTTRERDEREVLPWDHLDVGLDRQWLWDEWRSALDEVERDDCRWAGCGDCGVCQSQNVDLRIGPTGKGLLPL